MRESDVQARARAYAGAALDHLLEIAGNTRYAPQARRACAMDILEQAFGKVTQRLEVKASPLDDLSPEDFAAFKGAIGALAGGPEAGTGRLRPSRPARRRAKRNVKSL